MQIENKGRVNFENKSSPASKLKMERRNSMNFQDIQDPLLFGSTNSSQATSTRKQGTSMIRSREEDVGFRAACECKSRAISKQVSSKTTNCRTNLIASAVFLLLLSQLVLINAQSSLEASPGHPPESPNSAQPEANDKLSKSLSSSAASDATDRGIPSRVRVAAESSGSLAKSRPVRTAGHQHHPKSPGGHFHEEAEPLGQAGAIFGASNEWQWHAGSSKINGPKSSLVGELRLSSGSKSEPPSRPQVEWSKQKPYFGSDLPRNVSVELGKSAYLTCRVFERGDKTVSWLRPRENEILTVGRYTYVGDPRFTSINEQNNNDWILEIKDVTLNDSTSYECQVSTDPKMSLVYNLQVKAAKARIKQGEQYSCIVGTSIEFTCDSIGLGIQQKASNNLLRQQDNNNNNNQQTYWYFNGNLLNYHAQLPTPNMQAQDQSSESFQSIQPITQSNQFNKPRNFTIERDFMSQTSRFKLFNVQLSDSGNYTCKPTSAEPATIRLTVKKPNRNQNRAGGYYTTNGLPQPVYHKDMSKGRRFDPNGPENQLNANSASISIGRIHSNWLCIISIIISTTTSVLFSHHLYMTQPYDYRMLKTSISFLDR